MRISTTPAPLPKQYLATPLYPKQIIEQRETIVFPTAFITYYNYNKTGHTRTECPYPRYNANLNKIVEQENNNSNIKEI
jgi:hypothetical protein